MEMRTRVRAGIGALLAGMAISAPAVHGQRPEQRGGDVLVRVNGPAIVSAGETIGTVVSVNREATVDGAVGHLIVVNGTGRVTGTIAGTLTVVNGVVDLGPEARVLGDVLLYQGTLRREPGSTVVGQIREESAIRFGPVAGWLIWLSATFTFVLAGLLLAALAGRQTAEAARLTTAQPGAAALWGALLLFGLPAVAIALMITLIGIPLGLAIFLLVIPVLTLIGYLVAGTRVGQMILERGDRRPMGADGPDTADLEAPAPQTAHLPGRDRSPVPEPAAQDPGAERRPYAAVALGVLVLQLVAVFPILGALVVVVVSLMGAGAVALRSWRRLRASPAG